MCNSRQLVITVGLLIGCLFYSPDANAATHNAATINAASCSRADVGTAVSSAVAGDTVVIPACASTTWSSSLTINKGITLQGAGTTSGANLTQITYGVSPLIDISGFSSDQAVRVTGIAFDLVANSGSDRHGIHIVGKRYSGSGQQLTQWRIDHCKFNKGKRQIFTEG